MFIRNDAPDTPANLRWRFIEQWGAFIFCMIAIIRVTLSAFEVSQEHKAEIQGLGESVYPTSYLLDINDGQLKAFREGLPILIGGLGSVVIGS
jgi:hypothetical protein